jgi:hypothetical protein
VSGAGQPLSEEKRMSLRLAVLDAYPRAAKRREEAMVVISDAPDRGRRVVGRGTLGSTEVEAESALGMRLHRFSKGEVGELQAESSRSKSRWIEDVDMGRCSAMFAERWPSWDRRTGAPRPMVKLELTGRVHRR